MGIIDAHVHLYPSEVDADPAAWAAVQGEKHWALLCTRRRRDGRPVQSLPTVDGLLRAMDEAGVARAVLLGWYWENPATCIWQNRFYAACVRVHPDRFSAFATVHPRAGKAAALEEIWRAKGEGLVGIGELSPHSQGYGIDDPVFGEVLARAAELQMPVNLHVTDPQSRRYPGWVETPADDFVRLAERYPETNFVLAHWGGMLALNDARLRMRENIFYDTAASPLLYDAGVWQRALPALGAERVLFGSDFPLNLYPRVAVEAEMTAFLQEAKAGGAGEAVLGGNARRLLGV
ncbi:MAG TPA: amidohydrolase family protein [Opitutus sp.]|nr:amidohydrolase family protein [Opitutus sp.]